MQLSPSSYTMAKGITTINHNGPATRFIPDMEKLAVSMNGNATSTVYGAGAAPVDPRSLNYEASDLNEITRRQLTEDISAYRYDLEFCKSQLTVPDLTPQETRTFQLRILDLGHQIRHCQHRIEQMRVQSRLSAAPGSASYSYSQYQQQQQHSPPSSATTAAQPRTSTGTTAGVKRPRLSVAPKTTPDSEENDVADGVDSDSDDAMATAPATSVQRLGYWKCHLCKSRKYLQAGPHRVPSAPCKWPLKDISKMMNHFLDLHTEHSAQERCVELGSALAQNRGPFEYWLTRTKTQSLGDGSIIDSCIRELLAGRLPPTLRNLSKAAAAFPNQ